MFRYVKNKNVALANPTTKEYFKSAWTNELNKLSKEPVDDYKKLYEEELVKNKELQDKIDKAIEILRN